MLTVVVGMVPVDFDNDVADADDDEEDEDELEDVDEDDEPEDESDELDELEDDDGDLATLFLSTLASPSTSADMKASLPRPMSDSTFCLFNFFSPASQTTEIEADADRFRAEVSALRRTLPISFSD